MTQERIVIGVLAHVDAGKTTLCETLLYHAGQIRKRGRVDHGDSMLDTTIMERQRGITIFSSEASFTIDHRKYVLIDTPGHIDFSTEAERTLSVLDYAILVISSSDGIQNHTETLWKLLETYHVPTLVFLNKTDLCGVELSKLKRELVRLSPIIHSLDDENEEEIALLSESAMEDYVATGHISVQTIRTMVKERMLVPVFSGSALKEEGINELIKRLSKITVPREEKAKFGARVYKITHDDKGNRLSHVRLTGGKVSPRDQIRYRDGQGEKVNQIRFYEGEKYTCADEAFPGDVCVLTGLNCTYAGQGLGCEEDLSLTVLSPVMSYHVVLPEGTDAFSFLPKMKMLDEEDPMLQVEYKEQTKEIFVCLMGEVQTETLAATIQQRFGLAVSFDEGHVLYKETIQTSAEGVGHYEPLRHYAEVHILLEALPRGSGIQCIIGDNVQELTPTEQRLILTHMTECVPLGVLTGSPVTDIKMTLISGRSHEKHTEGGDFREATYRAIRQGLMKASSQLLEPVYAFSLEVPREAVGQILTDMRTMSGEAEITMSSGDMTTIEGKIPVSEMCRYWKTLGNLTRGRGHQSFVLSGYEPCHNAPQVIDTFGYVPQSDLVHPISSVFCERGAGFDVPWDQVDAMAHVPMMERKKEAEVFVLPWKQVKEENRTNEKIDEIMNREFGPIRRREYTEPIRYGVQVKEKVPRPSKQKLYLVDGYNFIHGTEPYRSLAKEDLSHAREALEHTLISYLHYTGHDVVLIYDGYKVKGNVGERLERNGLKIAFSQEGETGDALLEKIIAEIGKNYDVYAVTSDGLIQVTAVSVGVLRVSTREFAEEVARVIEEIRQKIAQREGKTATILWPDES